MATSIFDPAVQKVLDDARVNNGVLFASPADWRDAPIYFLMMDRFNNPAAAPVNLPYDATFGQFQGGSYQGVVAQLDYIKSLGFGSIWLSPVLKNPQWDQTAYHGYGIQNYIAAEPRFASNPANADEELRELVDEAHKRGLYIVMDIVLHHAGNVFDYVPGGAQIDWQNGVVGIQWHDETGAPNPAWADAPAAPPINAAVFPDELRHNELFTRQGNALSNGGQVGGDFDSLKGVDFATPPAGMMAAADVLIRAYQYVIARFDIDAFRIDTLKYIPPDFERDFGNAMREFGMSVGKKNFFTFGEVYDDENTISEFIGRNVTSTGDLVGVDAALDYPLFFVLPNVLKGLSGSPNDLAQVFQHRNVIEEDVLTSHGEAGEYFVTFLDNHDQPTRWGYTGPVQLVNQITLGLACLFCLQGVPCLYYGTEQGLSGHKHDDLQDDSMVREALWGKPGGGFDETNAIFVALQQIMKVRGNWPALRYGRQYFRPISGDGVNFGVSGYQNGVVAFSRILNDQEVVLVANTNLNGPFDGEVIIDDSINTVANGMKPLFSNTRAIAGLANNVLAKAGGAVTINEVDGSVTNGPAMTVQVQLQAGEAQILA
jgi:glycosidase